MECHFLSSSIILNSKKLLFAEWNINTSNFSIYALSYDITSFVNVFLINYFFQKISSTSYQHFSPVFYGFIRKIWNISKDTPI